MTVRPRGDAWQADVTLSGVRYRTTHLSKIDAEAWVLQARMAHLRGERIPPAAPPKGASGGATPGDETLHRVAEQALNHLWVGCASETANIGMARSIVRFWPSTFRIGDMTAAELDRFISHMHGLKHAPGTINRKLVILRRILRWAEERNLMVKAPKVAFKKVAMGRIRWVTEDEEAVILGLLHQWGQNETRDTFIVLLDTGLRPSELWRLTKRDVDLREKTLTVWKTKTGLPRTVYMTGRVYEIMSERAGKGAARVAPDARLFTLGIVRFRRMWDKVRETMGLLDDPHFVPYILRHTCASRMVQRGVPLRVVMEWMGHTEMDMTLRYAHLSPVSLKSAVAALEGKEAA